MDHRKRSIACRNKATNLGHHWHQCNGSNIGTLATHVTTWNDLKSCLIASIHVIGYELFLVNFFSNWMTTRLPELAIYILAIPECNIPRTNDQTISKLWLNIFSATCYLASSYISRPLMNYSCSISCHQQERWFLLSSKRERKRTYQLSKRGDHVQHCYALTYTKQTWDFKTDIIKQILGCFITHKDDLRFMS